MRTMLEGTIYDGGTGSSLLWGVGAKLMPEENRYQPAFAGKTGTTSNHSDGWFIGMTPTLVAGAWVGGEDPSVHFRTLGTGAGGHTALPIVGQFYSQILHKSKFQTIRFSTFPLPTEETLALMDIPPYREILEVSKRGILHDIFGKKDDHQPSGIKMPEKSTNEQTGQEEGKPAAEPAKKPFWQSMKEIFKKKSK